MMRRPAGSLVTALIALAIAGCGSSSSSSTAPAKSTSTASAASAKLAAPGEANPARPAPEIALKNSLGQDVRLSDYRGKAVYLMFIYDHCPDICPLMVSSFHTALSKMSPAEAAKAQIIAVSVDPKGDTPKTVKGFLAERLMTGRMQYLLGSKKELVPVWKQWGIQVQASPDQREVGHSAFVYGITASGKVRALYPSNFKPAWIVHDTPILAAS
ncbi:MAG: SCO family protein [Solirubrobacteraceae bacterium]